MGVAGEGSHTLRAKVNPSIAPSERIASWPKRK
jgi:hypothetical protein